MMAHKFFSCFGSELLLLLLLLMLMLLPCSEVALQGAVVTVVAGGSNETCVHVRTSADLLQELRKYFNDVTSDHNGITFDYINRMIT